MWWERGEMQGLQSGESSWYPSNPPPWGCPTLPPWQLRTSPSWPSIWSPQGTGAGSCGLEVNWMPLFWIWEHRCPTRASESRATHCQVGLCSGCCLLWHSIRQALHFLEVVNLPSSSFRSNCHACIKLTVEKVSAHFSVPFPLRKHSYRSRLGCPDGLWEEISKSSLGISWCQDTQKVSVRVDGIEGRAEVQGETGHKKHGKLELLGSRRFYIKMLKEFLGVFRATSGKKNVENDFPK